LTAQFRLESRMNINSHRVFTDHRLGVTATGSIAHFSAPLDFVVPPSNVKVASSSPLQGASVLVSTDRYAGEQHAAQIPSYTLASNAEKCTLEPVQPRNLGLLNFSNR
jgi:hypothetical protein